MFEVPRSISLHSACCVAAPCSKSYKKGGSLGKEGDLEGTSQRRPQVKFWDSLEKRKTERVFPVPNKNLREYRDAQDSSKIWQLTIF